MPPVVDHKPKHLGRLGQEFDAAYTAALSALAASKEHLGSLEVDSRTLVPDFCFAICAKYLSVSSHRNIFPALRVKSNDCNRADRHVGEEEVNEGL